MTKIAVISFPWRSSVPYKFLSDILKILDPIVDKIILIDGNTDRIKVTSEKVEIHDIKIGMHYLKDIRPIIFSAILWFIKCISVQLKISLELINERRNIDTVLFYVAYPYYLLPLITSKILNKKTIEIVTRGRSNFLFSNVLSLQDKIFYRLLDGISPESRALTKELGLEKYKDKLLPYGARFIETSSYTIKKKLDKRKNMVGYIGRLRKEKGVVEFVEAIYMIQKEGYDVEFLIGGDGDLLDFVNREKTEKHLRIMVTGFIKPENMPDLLNELKILILPTYSEGLPTIILEAMACGSIILATHIGAISDLIIDGETGFILEDNSPKCIANNIIKILNYPNIERIVYNARMLVEAEYTYDAAVNRYKEVLNGTMQKKIDVKNG